MKKFFSATFLLLVVFILPSIANAATPTYPLANITVYKFFKNMGYEVDTSRPAARTPDGFPIYGTNLPDFPLIQSNQFANTLVITNKNGDKILGIKLFFQSGGILPHGIAVLSKVTKALDENIFNQMKADWVAENMQEFLKSPNFNNQNKLISLESMNFWYKFSRSSGNGVLTVNIEADSK